MLKRGLYGTGLLLLAIGGLGFVMGSPLFGLLEVDRTHNWTHVVSGVLVLWYSLKSEERMRLFARVFGFVYFLAGVLGFLVPDGDFFAIMFVNLPDNVLHLALGAALFLMGYYRRKKPPEPSADPASPVSA